ncbi:glycosyltransferase [Paucibacter sp. O1-1]|nr:glycosyltransferase [Paucibacter sp. O1-1]MDA3828338.1 glycosyltransferase [Paucibacter sp. O1-1]
MNQKVLEVLIPTYRRPEAAIGAIDSVLAGADPRVTVFCHSNGVEPELEAAALLRENTRYDCFPENRGAVANFRKVLADSSADYVLFLSDEDRLSQEHLKAFVDFLAGSHHAFVFCSVTESSGENYFSLAALQGEALSCQDVLLLFPIDPTYLSGYCFRRELLSDAVIEAAFEEHDANVYPHLLLRNAIASKGTIGLFSPALVLKGAEANTGGDSHAHVRQGSGQPAAQTPVRQPLNPRIYGESARAKQFYYMLPRLNHNLASTSWGYRFYVKLYVLSAWLNITNEAHKHVAAAGPEIATLDAAITEQRGKSDEASILVASYNRILSIRSSLLRNFLVKFLWSASKSVKLMLFFRRFGVSRTLDFIRTKHG